MHLGEWFLVRAMLVRRVNQRSKPRCLAELHRLRASSGAYLSKTRLEWVLTVFSLTKSFSAISRLLLPGLSVAGSPARGE